MNENERNEVAVVENEQEVVMNNNVEPLTKGEIAGAITVGGLALIGAGTVVAKTAKYVKKAAVAVGGAAKKGWKKLFGKKEEIELDDEAIEIFDEKTE